MLDSTPPDPLALWRGIDDAVAREAARVPPRATMLAFPIQRAARPAPLAPAPKAAPAPNAATRRATARETA